MIRVDGIEVPISAMTGLAVRLHKDGGEALAARIGRNVDGARREMRLTERDRAELLAAIERHPDERLEELRLHLAAQMRGDRPPRPARHRDHG